MRSNGLTTSEAPLAPASPPTEPIIAIVGNPNAGKTTLFNSLTGSHQKVGNYPGVTVEKIVGHVRVEGHSYEVIDIPGLYSLHPQSEDERVAADTISGAIDGRKPDLVVCVLDASNLERNLFLFSQLAEFGLPTLVALTMVDRVKGDGREIDLTRLSNLLDVEIVPLVGHKSKGIEELKQAIARNLEEPHVPHLDLGLPVALESKVAALRERTARLGATFSSSQIRRALLRTDNEAEGFLESFPEVQEAFEEARKQLLEEGVVQPTLDVSSRYAWAGMVHRAAVSTPKGPKRKSLTDKIDLILTHRVAGLAIFAGIMMLVFQSIYSFAKPVMDGIQYCFDWLSSWISPHLAGIPILQSMIVKGLIAGVGGVMVFLPQILILFFFIAVLEGTGYLSRAAFLMDKLLGWCGLNGRAFIPLLSSFACAIPGIMAARVMPDQKSRLATILVAPLMSCSARLPVYLLLISAFIEPKFGPIWAAVALFGMHFLGLVIAVPVIWILQKKIIKGRKLPFLLELPPYQWPRWRDVWLAMYFRSRVFVKTAGTVIVLMSIVIWGLSYFPRLGHTQQAQIRQTIVAQKGSPDEAQQKIDEAQLEGSLLGRFGHTIEPVFEPAGFDWRVTTSILAAFPAREMVVPSLGIIFSLGDVDPDHPGNLKQALHDAHWPSGKPLFTPLTSVGLMVFFALCCQCMSTLATIKRETNSWKWPLFVFTYMTALAYIFAVAIFQIGRALGAA